MSSTSDKSKRNKFDYYRTPVNPIKHFLSAFLVEEDINRPDRLGWCDPCAGGDVENPMPYPLVLKEIGVEEDMLNLCTFDIRPESRAAEICDFLKTDSVVTWDVVISNPPFNVAMSFIEKALARVCDGGYVIFLLRLNFWGSKSRREFFENNMPKHCFIHSRRMSFTDDGATDSIEYAHFVWQKGRKFSHTKTHLLTEW